MTTYLYCLVPNGLEPPANLRGVGGERVRRLFAGAIDAWVGDLPGDRVGPKLPAIQRHDAVTDAAVALGATPLPARLGQTFASDAVCVASIAARESLLLTSLERVQGHVEMTVLATLVEPPETVAEVPSSDTPAVDRSPGHAYLLRLRERETLAQHVQALAAAVRRRVTGTVGVLVRDEAVRIQPSSPATLILSHLIARDSVDQYRDRLATLPSDAAIRSLLVRGPSAPYSFAPVGLEDESSVSSAS
jgi:hypothetical protein